MFIYIVVTDDGRSDADAVPFETEHAAIEYAKEKAMEYCKNPNFFSSYLNDHMIRDGWKYNAVYSCEGDNIKVIERPLRA